MEGCVVGGRRWPLLGWRGSKQSHRERRVKLWQFARYLWDGPRTRSKGVSNIRLAWAGEAWPSHPSFPHVCYPAQLFLWIQGTLTAIVTKETRWEEPWLSEPCKVSNATILLDFGDIINMSLSESSIIKWNISNKMSHPVTLESHPKESL